MGGSSFCCLYAVTQGLLAHKNSDKSGVHISCSSDHSGSARVGFRSPCHMHRCRTGQDTCLEFVVIITPCNLLHMQLAILAGCINSSHAPTYASHDSVEAAMARGTPKANDLARGELPGFPD